MTSTLPNAGQSMRVDSLDGCRPSPAKAVLPINADHSRVRTLIAEAIRRTGSQKAAAIEMHIDPAQLARQLQTGHLTVERLEALDAATLVELGKELIESYAPLATPAVRIRQQIRIIEAALDEVRQGVEALSA